MSFDRKPVILTIDDDEIIRGQIELILTQSGQFNIIPFPGAAEALEYLKDNSADLILLDFHMPGMTGLQMLEVLLADERLAKIPVIFLTGASDGKGEIQALQMGAADYITKPLQPPILLTRINHQLELSSHRNYLETLVAERTSELNEAIKVLKLREDVTLNLLARITEMRDSDTGCHIDRTTEFVRIIAEHLLENPTPGYELTEAEVVDIVKSAKLHDLGKIAIPDKVLLKPGKLDRDEFELIKSHTTYGETLLSEAMNNMNITNHEPGTCLFESDNFLKTARDIAYGHHEKWNGKGYPQGLKSMDIPISARIVAIADVYDALTSQRPYKEPFSHEKASEIIIEDSGQHFDPHLVEIFKKYGDEFEKIINLSKR